MKNLGLLSCTSASVPRLEGIEVKFSIDDDSGTFYINTDTEIIGIDHSEDEERFSMSYDEFGKSDLKVTGLQFLQGEESLCIATEHGDLLLINIPSRSVECVGTVDSGLVAMNWSPDQELLLLGTGADTIIAMTRDFDPVAEVDIHAKEFGKGEFITVGWGKKETQFHGSEGKAAARKKTECIEPALPWDDKQIHIVWRGDGQYFAVSMIDPVNGNRKFRVWNRECILQYTNEYIAGLECGFAWRPSGNLLASSQRKPHRHDIVFFEKNGLQHGEFTLPFGRDEVMVKQLEWNSDSSVLAIWLTDLTSTTSDESKKESQINHYLQLWTMSNYHWYLKQSLKFTPEKSPICVQWDNEQSYRLHVIMNNGRYSQYNYGKSVDDSTYPKPDILNICEQGDVMTEDNLSFVAVIDGKNVLMTPFKLMVVPPPMSAYKLILPEPANSVKFLLTECSPNDVAVYLSNGQVALYTKKIISMNRDVSDCISTKMDAAGGSGFTPQVLPHNPCALLQIEDNSGNLQNIADLHHWLWLDRSHMFAVGPGSIPGSDVVYLFDIDYEKSKLIARKSTQLENLILSAHLHNEKSVILQMNDGTLWICEISSLALSEYMVNGEPLRLPRPCTQVATCTFSGIPCVIGLSEHSRLYINDTELASDCSSFCLHDDFLFLTTHAHKLRCVSRNVLLNDVLRYFRTPIEGRSLLQNCSIIETHRAVERGSRIVTITPSDCRLILQMPRGNLEQIYPRCLVLSVITRLLKSLKYGEAFTIMKKHRINMNLLYDIDSKLFEENTSHFIKALDSTSNINIFISDLQDEDLTQTMYKQYFITNNSEADSSSKVTLSTIKKINRICDLLMVQMQNDEKRHIMSLVTAHVKKSPSEVGPALTRIKTLSDSIGEDEKLIGSVLKYMTVLVEGNTLFNEALGTYDFKLVMMVAEKSQLDPKEFMPVLHELQSYQEDYRKYKIDVKLRRYNLALENISKCGDDHFDECLQLITNHEMYRNALKIFKQGTEHYKTICCAYGDFLKKKHLYEEAGLVFSRCNELQQALECFTKATSCSLALSTAFKLKYDDTQIVELSYKLAERAKSNGKHTQGVEILEHYAKDVEQAVETALHVHLWPLATRMTTQYQRQDLEETHILPALNEAHEQTVESLESHRDVFVKHAARLEVVRQNKERQQREALLDGVGGIGMDSDLYSDTSSTMAGSVTSRSSSNFSRSTGRTSKSRRKKERRSYSLKEGSRCEDLALLHSLKTTIKAVDNLSDDIRSLCLHMSLHSLDEKAEHLQALYSDIRITMSRLLPTIWSQSSIQMNSPAVGPQSTVNSILASVQSIRLNSELNDSEEKQNFEDVELFIPPKFEKKNSWMLNQYEKS